jgi:TonB family protein
MGIYGCGLILLLLRFLRQLWGLAQLKRNSLAVEQHRDYTLVYSDQQNPAFTFGSTIFLSNSANFSPEEKEIILAHELVHVRQKHTLDILLLEAVILVQWFNPVIWLLKNSLRDQHEFLADQGGMKAAPDLNSYTRQIIGQILQVSPAALTHNFSNSQLKKRIIMMQQKTTLRNVIARAALTLPVAGVLFYAIACDAAQQEITPTQTEQTEVSISTKKIAEKTEVMPSFKDDAMDMYTYISENIKVPEMSDPQLGKVFAEFVVNADGKVTEVKILKGVGEPYDSEVTRVFTGMPNWNPARKNGKPVAMKMVIPIAFKSQNAPGNTNSKSSKNDGILFKGFESKFAGC